jgi:TonB family protein
MTLRGHVVITFWVHKDGRLTDLQIIRPSLVDGFNHSAYGALASSSPTYPLPPEYPDDKAFFTVTFYFNETPQAP